jgi:PAS domain S-box-containing protein
MEFNKKQFSSILEALRASPRGMNVTEVAKETGMNRATMAKYLEMLYVSGHADMRLFGTSKVYYISQRMPISAFLNFSSDLIIVLDNDSRVLNANDSFFEFTNTRREDVVHKNISHFAFPLKFDPPIDPYIMQAINGSGTTIESYYRKKDRGYYFNVKLIPLVFDEGEKGVTIIFEDITEKKLAEKALRDSNKELERKVRERTLELEKANEALRESEERYRMLTEKSYDVVYSVKPDGTITYVSPQLARYGYDPDEVVGRNFFEFIPPSDRDDMIRKFRDAVVKGEDTMAEFKLRGKDGQDHWAEVTGKTLYDGAGKPLFQVGTVRDISKRKLAEEALRVSEVKFKTLFEGASTAIFIIDVGTGNITDCNTYAAQLIGRPKEEIIGMRHFRLHPPDRTEQCHRDTMLHSSDGRVVNYEAEVLHKDGRRIPIFINSTLMEIGGRKIMMGSYLDISDLKRAERALHESEEKYRSLVENINDMAWETDENNRCTYASPRCREILGYGPEEIIGKTQFEFMAPEELTRVVGQVKPFLDAHQPFELLDYYVVRKDGRRAFLETSGMPMFDDNGRFRGYRGVNRDITGGQRQKKPPK